MRTIQNGKRTATQLSADRHGVTPLSTLSRPGIGLPRLLTGKNKNNEQTKLQKHQSETK